MAAEETGFVQRGFYLLAGMTVLVAIVLTIILYKPAPIEPPTTDNLPAKASEPGWLIRYNAVATLARRGSDQVPWNILHEMLDEKQQMKNFPATLADGRQTVNEAAARSTVITALKALNDWHVEQGKKNAKPAIPADLTAIYGQVDTLAQSPIFELKIQAERTRKSFFR